MLIRSTCQAALLLAGLGLPEISGEADAKEPVVTLQPMRQILLPEGSQISEQRLRRTGLKLQNFKKQQATKSKKGGNVTKGDQR